jgi:hypothetical protein
MTIGTSVGARALTPLGYLLTYLTVLVLLILVVDTVERHWVLHSWYRKGDVDAAVGCFVLGAVFFPVATLFMTRLERLRHPRLADHLRQSAVIYAGIIATAGYLIFAYTEQHDGLGYAVAAGACLLGIYAVALNGLVLWLMGRVRETAAGR